MIKKGKYFIKHFIKGNGEFITHDDFIANHSECVDFVTFSGNIAAIKQYIKATGIKTEPDHDHKWEKPSIWKINLGVQKGEKLYGFLTASSCEPNSCCKWMTKLNIEIPLGKVI